MNQPLDLRQKGSTMGLIGLSLLSLMLPTSTAAQEADASRVLFIMGWANQHHDDAQPEAARVGALAEDLLRVSGERLVERSALTVSPTPLTLPEGLDEEIRACVNDAIRAFSAHEVRRGNELIARCRSLIASARDPLLHDDRTAAEVLDSCLVLVRAILADQDQAPEVARAEALAQARVCRAETPETAPTVRRHTQEVSQLLAEVDERIRENGGVLIVRDGRGESCDVRVNGRAIGRTPATARLASGTYRVRADCPGGPARAERAQMVSGAETEIVLQPVNEALGSFPALRTSEDGRPALVYPEPAIDRFLYDVRRLSRAVDAARYAVVWLEQSGDTWSYQVGAGDAGGATMSALDGNLDPDRFRARLSRALTWRGRQPDVPLVVEETASFDPIPHVVGGAATAVVGAGLVATGWGLSTGCAVQADDGSCMLRAPDFSLIGPLGVPGVAMILGGTGWILAALAEDATSWFIAGSAAAAGAVGTAIYLSVAHATQGCTDYTDTGACRAFVELADDAVVTWTAATLTLAVGAAAYFVVGATDPGRGPRLSVGFGPSSIHLGGVF